MGYSPQFDLSTGRPLPRKGSAGAARLVPGPEPYIEATPGYAVPMLTAALAQALELGLEALDPADPLAHDLLEDGTIRTRLRPIRQPSAIVAGGGASPLAGKTDLLEEPIFQRD